jgi:hypothetical protein
VNIEPLPFGMLAPHTLHLPRSTYGVEMKGHGMFLHGDPDDRPAKVFGGTTTLLSGPEHPSHLLLPVIPRAQGGSPSIRRGPFPR